MGNAPSTNLKSSEKKFENFYDIIDYIATYYILTMDFKSLSKLSEKEYCENLIVLTADIIEKYFTDMDITFLAQKLKAGQEVNELKTENVSFITRDNLETIDISNDKQKSIKKRRVCIGIAKFYVKIAHIFAAIVMTINPVYTFKDINGQTVKAGLLKKDRIPKGLNRKLFKLNICDNRIRALKKGLMEDEMTGDVSMHPKVCDMNVTKDGTDKSLEDEPGISELLRLYLDDEYDYSTGLFRGMSAKTKSQYNSDLKTFYTAFTGNETMPPEITKFSEIKLRDYNKKPGCQGENPILKQRITINKKDKLFIDYAENIKNMIQNAATNQSKLLDIINELFTYVIDPYSGKRVIRINPKLNEASLQKAVENTRKFIINLYIKCETDYVNGIKLYEAIVESRILETTKEQINSLKNEASKIINETKSIAKPVPEKLVIPPPLQPQPHFLQTPEIITEDIDTETYPTQTTTTETISSMTNSSPSETTATSETSEMTEPTASMSTAPSINTAPSMSDQQPTTQPANTADYSKINRFI